MSAAPQIAADPIRELVGDLFRRYLAPPPALSVHEWAERYRELPKATSAEAGRWRSDRMPHAIEPMECLSDPDVRAVVCMWASQVAKTEVGLNWLGRAIHLDPGPILWCTSTEAQLQKLSQRRLDPMLDAEPLRDLVARRKGRESQRTMASISFVNGSLNLVSANSPSGLSSDPIRYAVCDEVDRYAPSSGQEGDALALILARQTTFETYGAKTLFISSPSIAGQSRIEQLFEQSDQRRRHVPCPICGTMQALVWDQVRWDHEVPREDAPETARYYCESCDEPWTDAQRWHACTEEAGARWIASKPFRGVAGFGHLSQLYSTFTLVATLVREWLEAQGKPDQVKAFVNTRLGLPYSLEVSEAPETIRGEVWDGFDVPVDACLLLGFADVQGDRLELTVCGVGPDAALYPVEHLALIGNTDQPEVWADLAAHARRSWKRSDGRELRLAALGVDCGYRFERVCRWCMRVPFRAFAIKGVQRGIGEPIVRERKAGRTNAGLRFHIANSDASKFQVLQKLNLQEGPGRVHYPARECFGERYFDQLRAERLVRRIRRGYPVLEWHLRDGARNEALDCLAGILAVQEWLNPALGVLAAKLPPLVEGLPPAASADSPADRGARPAPPPPAAPRPRLIVRSPFDSGARHPGRRIR